MADQEIPAAKLMRQHNFILGAFDRAARTLPPPEQFGNPIDYNVHLNMRASFEIAFAMSNTLDDYGISMGQDFEGVLQNCRSLTSGSKKQAQRIAELEQLLTDGGPGRGNHK